MKSQPTLEDVARLAGVSTATVSRVLNTPDLVRAETRDRVRAVVDQLGYTPHFGGRALAIRRTNTVGAIIPTMENAIFARGLQALQTRLAARGVTLLVATSDFDPIQEEEQIHALLARGVDGLVLIGEARGADTYAFLARREVPVVLLWSHREGCLWTSVGFDNHRAAAEMAALVVASGHRRVAMVAGVTAGNDRAAARVDGVRAALAAHGAPAPRVVEAAYSIEAGRTAATTLLTQDPAPSAIICGNDVLAAGVYIAARDLGLRIPDDISVTGFDDIDLATVLDPPLTTVHVPHRRMGQAAAEVLLRLADAPAHVESIALETEIRERGSLGPGPSETAQ
ncbi:MAG: LacI family DNA-binding transcriptional regulator [Pseudomonadota bacterium]